MESTQKRKTLTGTVISNKMDKTVVVEVHRRFAHPKFKKVVTSTSKYMVHDEKNQCNPGDFISVCETRPLSKHKRWRLVEVLKPALLPEAESAK